MELGKVDKRSASTERKLDALRLSTLQISK
jgi:hypothetical protein